MGALIAGPQTNALPKLYIKKRDRKVSPRGVTKTQIVCGDCCGDDSLPRKTFLTPDGRCDCCGGRSYVLAANLEIARRIAVALAELHVISIS